MPRKALQLLPYLGAAQVHPADHALDERVLVGKLEQPLGLFQRLPGLDDDAALEAYGGLLAREVLRQEVPPQRRDLLGNPAVLLRAVVPEVIVRVEPHTIISSSQTQVDLSARPSPR